MALNRAIDLYYFLCLLIMIKRLDNRSDLPDNILETLAERDPAVKAALREAGLWLENRAYGQSYAQGLRAA
ncbi:hypothetical protein A33M_1291 [Rhodovulum sp. PH10]|uniref:hypothetical protein n=1 Tax=Rhodovulum sp. PH10 TaxID=1187851 RepID=UPI00027C2296|nr:hypothetical protein [Rhodovulum sp. PH10]EJW09450.1 hypothetical protein A33M_1291 [Rhodovulum sp. PH10]